MGSLTALMVSETAVMGGLVTAPAATAAEIRVTVSVVLTVGIKGTMVPTEMQAGPHLATPGGQGLLGQGPLGQGLLGQGLLGQGMLGQGLLGQGLLGQGLLG